MKARLTTLFAALAIAIVGGFAVNQAGAQSDVQPCFQFTNAVTGELIPLESVDATFLGTDHQYVMSDPEPTDAYTACYYPDAPHTLSPGSYWITANSAGFVEYSSDWGVWETTTYQVPMTPLAEPEPSTYSVTFNVREQDGSLPTSGSVIFDGVDYPLDENGSITFTDLADGTYIFQVRYYNNPMQSLQQNVTVAGEDVVVDVVLPNPVPRFGWEYSCPPIADVAVGDTVTVGYAVSELDGRADVTNVTVTPVRAGATATQSSNYLPAGGSITGEFTIPITQADLDQGYVSIPTEVAGTRPGGRATMNTGRSMACAITPAAQPSDGTVVVVDADGVTPVAGATVTLGDSTAVTDVSGSVVFPDLADGTYQVYVAAPDGRIVAGELTIAGSSNSATLQLPAVAANLVIELSCPEIPYGTRVGETVTFGITVTNTGNVTLENVRGSAFSPWGGGVLPYSPALPTTLAPGESYTGTFTNELEVNAALQNRFSGTASVNSSVVGGDPVSAQVSLRDCTFLAVEDFTISATCPEIPDDIAVGDTVEIPVVVSSTGDRRITSSVFSADREGTIDRIHTLGTEPTVVNRVFTTTVTQADLDAGSLDATVTLTAPRAARGEFAHSATVACQLPVQQVPTVQPTTVPTTVPTIEPTIVPTTEPTVEPTTVPTTEPTVEPTIVPTTEPTVEPTTVPTTEPTVEPTTVPTTEPTAEPTTEPTAEPTTEPTVSPAAEPTPTAASVSRLPSTGAGEPASMVIVAAAVAAAAALGAVALRLRTEDR